MDRGAWRARAHGVAQSWTRLSDFSLTFMDRRDLGRLQRAGVEAEAGGASVHWAGLGRS